MSDPEWWRSVVVSDDDLPEFEPPSPPRKAVVVEDEPVRRRRLPDWMTRKAPATPPAPKKQRAPRRREPMEESPGTRAVPVVIDDPFPQVPTMRFQEPPRVNDMLKRAALGAREEARQRAQDVDQVTSMAKRLFFQNVVDTEDFEREYGDPSEYAEAESRGLYTKSVRDILTSDL